MSGVVRNLSDNGHLHLILHNNQLIVRQLHVWHDDSKKRFIYVCPTDFCHFMKTIYTLILIAVSFGAIAQSSFVNKHIIHDGYQLQIRVDIEDNGCSVHYSRLFDVSNMEKATVKALENRISDSLEQNSVELNAVVIADPDQGSKTRRNRADYRINEGADTDENSRRKANATLSLSPDDVLPSSVLVREDKENGRLWMQYIVQKDGDELIIERTANVIGKSEREKQAIIRDTERRFGIRTGNQ